MPHPLDSARARLERADENIRHLNSEVSEFLGKFPVVYFEGDINFTQEDRDAFEQLREKVLSSHPELQRFMILAGEVIHHLRAAFDHLAWQLSSDIARGKFPNKIEFPVCGKRKETLCRLNERGELKHSPYCGKVKGIDSVSALTAIDGLQPYHRPNESRYPLLLIHEMDRIDKHRELNISMTTVQVGMDAYGTATFPVTENKATGGIRFLSPLPVMTQVKVKGRMVAQVAFRQLGEREDEPIIPTLKNLLLFSRNNIESFTGEF